MQPEKSNLYNEWHSQYAADDDTTSVWHEFVKQNIRNIADVQDSVILEVGCGRGGMSNYIANLQPFCKELHACDYSESAIEIGESKFGTHQGRIVWSQQDIQALKFDDQFFDTIISCETIEHVPDPRQAVRELYRVLKSGGRLYLTCPNYFNFFGLYCVYRKIIGKPYTEGQPFVNYLLLPQLLHWLKDAGFSIEKHYTTNLVFPLRAHYHFFEKEMPVIIRWLGFRTFFILKK